MRLPLAPQVGRRRRRRTRTQLILLIGIGRAVEILRIFYDVLLLLVFKFDGRVGKPDASVQERLRIDICRLKTFAATKECALVVGLAREFAPGHGNTTRCLVAQFEAFFEAYRAPAPYGKYLFEVAIGVSLARNK